MKIAGAERESSHPSFSCYWAFSFRTSKKAPYRSTRSLCDSPMVFMYGTPAAVAAAAATTTSSSWKYYWRETEREDSGNCRDGREQGCNDQQ